MNMGCILQDEDQWSRFTHRLDQWLLSKNCQTIINFSTSVGMRPVIPRWKGIRLRNKMVHAFMPEK
jgi:hypothetical protein